MRILPAAALIAACTWAPAHAAAPVPPGPPPATLHVTGQARVSETPDRVYIDLGVTTRARQSEAAASRNAGQVAAVIAAVKRAAGADALLTTTEYSVSPDYHSPPHGGPVIVGYTVTNVVRVRLDNLRKVGAVLDAATRQGSNNVRDIRFAVRDEQAPRDKALRRAALSARQDAEALAQALGLRIVRVLEVQEESPPVIPRPMFMQAGRFAAAQPAPGTQIEAGAIVMSATVSLTVEVAPAKR